MLTIVHDRNDLRGHAQTLGHVTPSDVVRVRDSPEERSQWARLQVIPDGMGLTAQAVAGDGASTARAALGHSGGGRSQRGRQREGSARSVDRKEDFGRDRGRRGRVWMKRAPDASAAREEAFRLEAVESGSVSRTAGRRSHTQLRKMGQPREDAVTEADLGRMDLDFPRVHGVSVLLKRWLVGTHKGARTT